MAHCLEALLPSSTLYGLVSIQFPDKQHYTLNQILLLPTSVPPVSPCFTQEQQTQSLAWPTRSYVVWPLVISPKSLSPLLPWLTMGYFCVWPWLTQDDHMTVSRPLHILSPLPRTLALCRDIHVGYSYTSF